MNIKVALLQNLNLILRVIVSPSLRLVLLRPFVPSFRLTNHHSSDLGLSPFESPALRTKSEERAAAPAAAGGALAFPSLAPRLSAQLSHACRNSATLAEKRFRRREQAVTPALSEIQGGPSSVSFSYLVAAVRL